MRCAKLGRATFNIPLINTAHAIMVIITCQDEIQMLWDKIKSKPMINILSPIKNCSAGFCINSEITDGILFLLIKTEILMIKKYNPIALARKTEVFIASS